jgi:hypothetical protein
MKKILILLIILSSFACKTSKNENKAKLTFPEVASLLSPSDTFYFFYTREIDKTLTTNCGVATPGGAVSTGVPGAVPGATPTPTTGTSTSKYTILSQIIFKTGETLTMKFLYDSLQYQGALDQQQGFTLTGGIFGNTVKGTQGTIKWQGQSLGYIDEANKTAQTLTFLIVDINLRGTFTPGSAATGTTPTECYTTGDGKCTSTITTTKCFTQDYITCMNNTAATGATPITISGNINCNAANVIPQ